MVFLLFKLKMLIKYLLKLRVPYFFIFRSSTFENPAIDFIFKHEHPSHQSQQSLSTFPPFFQILNKDVFAFYASKNRDQVEFIYLMYNNLNEAEAGAFEEFVNVRNINFGVNLLETIKRNYFLGTMKIEFLNFRSNLIHSIEAGSFDELTELAYIYLDDNCLTHIPDHLFSHTRNIRNIFIQQNRLVHFPNNFMRTTQKLFSLNVADNRLQDISNLFRFKGLLSLIASNNKLNPINVDGISDTEMTSLNIDNTTILEINFVRNLRRLRELYAAHNQIKSFDVEMLSGCRELTYISLQSNPLKSIKIEAVDEIFPSSKFLTSQKAPWRPIVEASLSFSVCQAINH